MSRVGAPERRAQCRIQSRSAVYFAQERASAGGGTLDCGEAVNSLPIGWCVLPFHIGPKRSMRAKYIS